MSELLDFPAPRRLTPEDLANPVIRALLDTSTTFEEALSVLDPEPDPPGIVRLDSRRRRPASRAWTPARGADSDGEA